MNLNELLEMWRSDCPTDIEKEDLDKVSLQTINLHAKYFEMWKKEKIKLLKIQKSIYPRLRLAKKEFYTMGPHEDTPQDWVMPPQGKVLKAEVQEYLDADKDLIELNLKMAVQNEIVSALEDMVKEIQNRRWAIKHAIDFVKWTEGG